MSPAHDRARWLILFLGVTLLLVSCSPGPVRTQARFLYTQHAALFVDDDGRGGYLIELREIRNVPPLSEIEVAFDRPNGGPWVERRIIEAADNRFAFSTPVFPGFDRSQDYFVRIRLLSFDRFTELDRLRQRVRPTPAGSRPATPSTAVPDGEGR